MTRMTYEPRDGDIAKELLRKLVDGETGSEWGPGYADFDFDTGVLVLDLTIDLTDEETDLIDRLRHEPPRLAHSRSDEVESARAVLP